MIQIPNEVKTLLISDSVWKNFRAVFEDGSPDITNSQIVRESLHLRESVFSGDSFTFGAAEAPTIQFETVGVPNILGKWFQAWLEVDASSLPESMQVDMPDLSYPVYPIALGRFVVTACPRNQGAMAHRRVTGSANAGTGGIHLGENLEAIVNTRWITPKGVSVRIPVDFSSLLIVAGYDAPNPKYIADTLTVHKTADDWVFASTRVELEITDAYGKPDAVPGSVWIRSLGRMASLSIDMIDSGMINMDGCVFSGDADFAPVSSEVLPSYADIIAADIMASHPGDVYFDRSYSHEMTEAELAHWLRNTFLPLHPGLRPRWVYQGSSTIGGFDNPIHQTFGLWASPVRPTKTDAVVRSQVPIFIQLLSAGETHLPLIDADSLARRDITYTLKTYAVPDAAKTAIDKIHFNLPGEKIPKEDGGGTLFDRDELGKCILAALELRGCFGQYARGGGPKLLKLSQVNHQRVTRAMYAECWWDEYDLEPIGSISYKLGDEDLAYTFGSGRSTYALACSDIFQLMDSPTDNDVQDILDISLVPALTAVKYTPAQLTAMGLPWLEAGDPIIVEAEDGTEVETYVLTRELSGIQHLVDDISADGATIVEVTT